MEWGRPTVRTRGFRGPLRFCTNVPVYSHAHLPAPMVLLHMRLTSRTHSLSQPLVPALMGFRPQSPTYSSLMHMYRLPQQPPLCSFPEPRMSLGSAQPEWLILSDSLAKARHCLYLKSLPQFHSGRHICQHLRALGYILGGLRRHRTVPCWVIHKLSSPAKAEGLTHRRTATSSLSALDIDAKANGILFRAGGQG